MKKKKALLALLASLCVAGSAAAFAACSDNGGESTYDPAMYAAYQTYAPSGMTYEEWVDSIVLQLANGGNVGPAGQNGVGIEDVDMVVENGTTYLVFTFTDGTSTKLPL